MMVASTNSSVIKIDTQEELKPSVSLTTKAIRRLRRDRLTLTALGVITLLAILSYSAPFFERVLGVSYSKTDITEKFRPPCFLVGPVPEGVEDGVNIYPRFCNPQNLLGTDDIGRDHLVRLMYGGQVSLGIGFMAAFMSLVIGISVGMFTGYFGGFIDDAVNWFITTLTSIPTLFLLLIISSVIITNPTLKDSPLRGPGVLILILGLLGWTGTTRLVRGETLGLREREYIVAARAMGASPVRIMFQHILPNLFSVVIVTLAGDIGGFILAEAGLSFLGLGVQSPTPSWGNMLTDAQQYFNFGPYLVVLPGAMIFITVLCLFVMGDGLRDAFDPTSKD
jgi:peptide/nickel transport system permease protein